MALTLPYQWAGMSATLQCIRKSTQIGWILVLQRSQARIGWVMLCSSHSMTLSLDAMECRLGTGGWLKMQMHFKYRLLSVCLFCSFCIDLQLAKQSSPVCLSCLFCFAASAESWNPVSFNHVHTHERPSISLALNGIFDRAIALHLYQSL